MRLPESLRLRIQIWHGFLLAAVLSVFAFAAYKYQQSSDIRQIDEQITQRLRLIIKVLQQQPPPKNSDPGQPPPVPPPARPFKLPSIWASLFDTADPPSFYYLIWNADGSLRARSKTAPPGTDLPSSLEEEPHHSGERTREEFREMFTFLSTGECVLAGRSIAHDLAELSEYARWLAALSFGVLIMGLAVGWAIATRSLQPVTLISEVARRIAAGSLSERIPIREEHSELGVLASTLNETFSQIETSFSRQHQFVADAAHELRTPVAIILAQAQQTLNRDRETETYKKALESCVSAARRLRTLTDSLLELALHDAGVSQPKRKPCDLAHIAREVAAQIGPLIEERQLRLVLELEATPCEADPDQMTQLALNLLSNAADHTPVLGCITLRTACVHGLASLSVSDTGVGIRAEDLPRIFDRFFRADDSRSRKTGGAGLGLAICKAIAEAHHARLGVSSAPGEGSTFTLEMPALESAGVDTSYGGDA